MRKRVAYIYTKQSFIAMLFFCLSSLNGLSQKKQNQKIEAIINEAIKQTGISFNSDSLYTVSLPKGVNSAEFFNELITEHIYQENIEGYPFHEIYRVLNNQVVFLDFRYGHGRCCKYIENITFTSWAGYKIALHKKALLLKDLYYKDNPLEKRKYDLAHGGVYEGEYLNGKYHGFGKLTQETNITLNDKRKCKTTTVYTGKFQNGKYDGEGVLSIKKEYQRYIAPLNSISPSKYVDDGLQEENFKGIFKDGKYNGEGILKKNIITHTYNGIVETTKYQITGNFYNGLSDGYSEMFKIGPEHSFYYYDTLSYKGFWKEGKFHGVGNLEVMEKNNNVWAYTEYKGSFVDGIKNGVFKVKGGYVCGNIQSLCGFNFEYDEEYKKNIEISRKLIFDNYKKYKEQKDLIAQKEYEKQAKYHFQKREEQSDVYIKFQSFKKSDIKYGEWKKYWSNGSELVQEIKFPDGVVGNVFKDPSSGKFYLEDSGGTNYYFTNYETTIEALYFYKRLLYMPDKNRKYE